MRRSALAFGLICTLSTSVRADDSETFFETKIRPVLSESCLRCHGGKKVSNGLRVDSREALLKGGKSGPALLPGDADRSLLIQAIRRTHAEIQMPPDQKLPDAVVTDFAAWVKQGAPWPKKAATLHASNHWAFEPVHKVDPPGDPSRWSEHPIDCFVNAKRRAAGVAPVGPAEKRVLLRRITFDLIGLPPTPDEVDAFVHDSSPDSFTKVIDRLLASPHYGERWGRHWMDVARYADTGGDNADYPIPEARFYRDYIIDAFNTDKPYDEFVREQLAGDILAKRGPPDKYAEQVIATGFLALSRRYATAPYELWHLTLEDAIETTGRAFMGLTLRCARCHDHKYDPVTNVDYYAMYGIFASTQFPWAGGEEFHSMKRPREHFVQLGPAATPLAAYQQQIKQLEADIQRAEKEGDPSKTGKQSKLVELKNQLWELRRSSLPRDLTGAYAVQEGKAHDEPIQVRGEPNDVGPVVKRGAPRFLCSDNPLAIPSGASGRLQLAEWLTRPDHPLTARVLVNRLWQHHFGKGLVATPSNFGLRGEPPTHPELLNYLAARFVESGWSIKAMHRLILTSKTYQLASSEDELYAAKDPGNRWYWRFDRRRLDAEAIRDSLLAVSGNLNRTRPGPHPFPPIDKWTWTQHNPFKDVYPTNHRSVYLMTQRFQRNPFMALFDGPDTNTTTEQRARSTVPLQALYLMNNPFVKAQAEGFARRLLSASNDASERIELAHRLAWSRPPSQIECSAAKEYVIKYRSELAKSAVSDELAQRESWTSLARVLLTANEFLYVD
jgi:hypothetical protein